jgi:hypothetical protein
MLCTSNELIKLLKREKVDLARFVHFHTILIEAGNLDILLDEMYEKCGENKTTAKALELIIDRLIKCCQMLEQYEDELQRTIKCDGSNTILNKNKRDMYRAWPSFTRGGRVGKPVRG